ncbi:homeobox-leucine zipper protein HDG11 [Glycine max]|uniref:homeobox-leucine zipper protein HDG11 n=1 Tax=Glycine max TaxID=3847 RepID=UPI00023C69E9|nr:homeobox-leucine zipper protein HDG11 [Glycine max]
MSASKSGGGSGRGQQGDYHWRNRHGRDKVARLEEIFKECTHPNEVRRRQIGEELGLDPEQTINERLDTDALRLENERIQSENNKMRETLENLSCGSCGGRAMEPVKHQLSLQVLRGENILLTKECERITSLMANNGININPALLPVLPSSSSHDALGGSLLNQPVGIPAHNQFISNHDNHYIPAAIPTPFQDNPIVSPPSHNQDINPAPTIDQHIPTLDDPTLIGDNSPLISSFDYNIPALVTALDRNLPAMIHPHDQNNSIPSAEKEIHQVSNNSNNNLSALELDAVQILNNDMLPQPMKSLSKDMDSVQMLKIAEDAMEELMKLLSLNEPFWFRSLLDGKFNLRHDCYKRIFGRSNCLSGPHVRMESSKDSRVVKMSGAQLVEMFLNSDKWVDLFPTIVKKAQTIQVLESGSSGNRNGALQLVNAEMHILSHLVPSREFLFLRYCKQIEVGIWAIGDVSIDSSTYKTTVSHARRLPSGCLIQEKSSEGLCMVSWMEHVEVNEKMQTHNLFRDTICGNNAYGADRWVMTLERMCERFASYSAKTIPSCETGGVVRSPDVKRNIMHLTHRMVKMFCGNLDMQDNPNFPNLTRMNNNGVKLSIRVNHTGPNEPKGTIIGAAICFRVPLSPQIVFDNLIDNNKRAKWDTLCDGSAGHEIQRISTGSNPGNCISIMRPFIPKENNMVILQESYVDALGSMLVFAPFYMEGLDLIMKGEDSSLFPILPSGLTISWDYQSNKVPEGQSGQVGQSRGSLVTLMFQLLASSTSKIDNVDMKLIGSINTLVTSTVEKIKDALNCSNSK